MTIEEIEHIRPATRIVTNLPQSKGIAQLWIGRHAIVLLLNGIITFAPTGRDTTPAAAVQLGEFLIEAAWQA